ncbi:MAG: protein kinase [Planctomycetota bacterium]
MKAPLGYRLEHQIGVGGSGTVWLARVEPSHPSLESGLEVALKRPLEDSELAAQTEAAFEREVDLSRALSHPNLVELLEHGRDGHGRWLATRFLPGPTLRSLLERGGSLPEPFLRSMGADLAAALAALHAAGWIHGDVTPDNARLDGDGRAVLLDLGLVRPIGAPPPAGGSLAYWAPELLEGRSSSSSVDVFGLGTVLYELATGQHPFGADGEDDAARLIRRIAEARAPNASRYAPRLSPLFDALLDSAMRRDPGARPDAHEFAAALSDGEASPWWRRWIELHLTQGGELRDDLFETHLLPFVGRAGELRELRELYSSVVGDRRGAVRVLRGSLGVGKSRLVGEFVARQRTSADPCTFLHVVCTERSEVRPLGTAIELLEHWLQLASGQPLGPREVRLLSRMIPPRDVRVLERALAGQGAAPAEGSFAASLAEWAAALARERPLVVLIDDLNVARASTLSGLRTLFERSIDAPLLLLLAVDEDRVAKNPEPLRRLLQRAVQFERGGETRLRPLQRSNVGDLVNRVFHHSNARLRISDVLWEHTRGNPSLIEEVLRTLDAAGQVEADDDDRLHLAIAPDSIPEPASVASLARARLAALGGSKRRWIERLAVAGSRLEPAFLSRAFPPTELGEVEELLAELARDGWLEPSGERYRFANPVYREVAYRSTSQERRSRLHRMVARAFEEAGSADLEAAFQRAFHLRRAGEHAALLDLVEELLPELDGRGSPLRQQRITRWALEALDEIAQDGRSTELERTLLERGARSAQKLGDRKLQRRYLDRLAELPSGGDEARHTAVLYLLHGEYAYAIGEFGLARGMLRGASEFGTRAGTPEVLSASLRGRALIEAEYEDLSEARQLAARALDEAEDPVGRARALLVSARIELLDDWIERAAGDVTEALGELRRTDREHATYRAIAFLLRGRLLRCSGRPVRALAAIRHALSLARDAEERSREVELAARLGWLLIDAGRLQEAETWLRDAQLAAEEVEDQRATVLCDLWLGILMWEQGTAGARTRIGRALDLASDIGFHRAEAVGRAVRARIDARKGDLEAASRQATRAAELVREHGAELSDRIVVVGTQALIDDLRSNEVASRAAIEGLLDRLDTAERRIRDPRLRADFGDYSRRLLDATARLDSPVYPRTPTARERARPKG